MVLVRKKNGDIKICIDFRNLNKASLKDNFPLPTMEQILQSVAGSELMSFLDGFSGYNQILVHPDDRLKTKFRTKWGTYAYQKMPFGLINAGATFQRAMDITFKGLINRTVVVYLDDITMFSKERSNHLHDLNQIFQRCKKYGISLNPKKSFFALDQGKLLGFIVSKDGIYIDPDRIKEISEIPFPHNKKSMQSFLGQINFVKRFVPDFSEIILPLQTMIKKNSAFKWGSPEKEAPFLLKAHTKVIVPFSSVRQLLIQRELGEKRANWVTTLQEYDLEIKPAKIVRGQGFCRLLAGASNIPESSDRDQFEAINHISIIDSESQYADLIFYLKNGYAPPNLSYKSKRAIRLKATNFTIIDDVLFRQNYDLVLLRCLEKSEAQKVLQELHDGPAGGHFGADTTAHKVIHAGYYWPTLFRDVHEYVRKCRNCQTSSGRQRKSAFPLQPVNIEQPFEQWGLDIIGEINPNSSKQHKYILTATDYFTKWVEAIPLKTTNSEAIIEFIDQFIITRFGVPNALVFDNASYFSGNAMFDFAIKRGFKLKYSANYYPQVLPTNLILPSLALVQFIEESPSSSLQLRHDQILKLEEEREKAKVTHAKHQQIIKSSFDSLSSGSKQFQVGDLVLKWDKAHEDKGKQTKFQKMWLGPFQICEKIGHSTFILQDLSGLRDSLPVNGLILKKFFN
eukprot:PITA_25277